MYVLHILIYHIQLLVNVQLLYYGKFIVIVKTIRYLHTVANTTKTPFSYQKKININTFDFQISRIYEWGLV